MSSPLHMAHMGEPRPKTLGIGLKKNQATRPCEEAPWPTLSLWPAAATAGSTSRREREQHASVSVSIS